MHAYTEYELPHQDRSKGKYRIIPLSVFTNMGLKVNLKFCARDAINNL